MERPPFPTDRDVLDARFRQHALETDVAYPGRVQSYDPVLQVADVVPLIRQQVPKSGPFGGYDYEDLPVVPCVPVIFPRVGAWALSFAIQPGDTVQLLVNSSAIGHWRVGSGDVTDPGDLRRQHLSHAVAIPGLYVRQKALRRAPSATGPNHTLRSTDAALVLGSDADAARITFRPDGALEIAQGDRVVAQIDPDGTVHMGGSAGQFVALANLVEQQLTALKTAIDGAAVAPSDGGATFKGNLMTALASWPSPVAAAKTKAT